MKKLFLIFALLCASAEAQILQQIMQPAPSASSNTFTLLQHNEIWTGPGVTSYSFVPTSTTTAGKLGVLFATNTNGSARYITAAGNAACSAASTPSACCTGAGTGSCGTWTARGTGQGVNAAVGAIGFIDNVNETAIAAIPITVTASDAYWVFFYEFSPSTGSATLDVCGTQKNSTGATSQPGATLTLTGSSDVIVQGVVAGATPTGVPTSPSYADFLSDTDAGGADLRNTTNGTGPSWPFGSAVQTEGAACAYK